MMKTAIVTALAVALSTGAAFAQANAPKAPSAATTTQADPASDAKFKAADKNNDGFLTIAELTGMTVDMAKSDTNKDGKLSHDEFAAAMKSGAIR